MQRMMDAGVTVDLVSYSAVIHACAKVGNIKRAEHWFAQLTDSGMKPGTIIYNVLIHACAKAGDLGRAEYWLRKTKEDGDCPDVYSYNAVIDACVQAQQTEKASGFLSEMKANGIKPTPVTFTTLAKCYSWNGEWQKVEQLGRDMKALGVGINDYFLNALLSAYASAKPKQPEKAEAAFREALSSGVRPNKFIWSSLTRAIGAARGQALKSELGMGDHAEEQRTQPRRAPAAGKQDAGRTRPNY